MSLRLAILMFKVWSRGGLISATVTESVILRFPLMVTSPVSSRVIKPAKIEWTLRPLVTLRSVKVV